jgi:hypothetical protein
VPLRDVINDKGDVIGPVNRQYLGPWLTTALS